MSYEIILLCNNCQNLFTVNSANKSAIGKVNYCDRCCKALNVLPKEATCINCNASFKPFRTFTPAKDSCKKCIQNMAWLPQNYRNFLNGEEYVRCKSNVCTTVCISYCEYIKKNNGYCCMQQAYDETNPLPVDQWCKGCKKQRQDFIDRETKHTKHRSSKKTASYIENLKTSEQILNFM